MKIAIFYHCLFYMNGDICVHAFDVVNEQMYDLEYSGLLEASKEFHVGINGGKESSDVARMTIPHKADLTLHGLASRSENLTILMIEDWVKTHPGWLVLYMHSKGATHNPGEGRDHTMIWRRCMLTNLVIQWRRCVRDLERNDSVGCHWLEGMGSDKSQNYWGGNFWWARSDFLRTLPSLRDRDRVKLSGVESLESRYEAEVWIGNGPRKPRVKDYHPVNPSVRNACLYPRI